MSDKGTSADQQILAQQQALQAKLKKGVWLGAAVIALFLVLYIANQSLTDGPSADETNSESSTASDEVTLTNAEIEQFRDKFRSDLAEFENRYQSILDNPDIINWQPKRVSELTSQKDKALSEFARSSFQTASITLSELIPDVQQLDQDWQNAYKQKIDESALFLAQEKINQARFAYSQAVEIMPSDPDGQELKLKLDGYEEILSVRQAFRIAQVENNVSLQIDLLESLIRLDPSLTEEQNTLNRLKQERVIEQHADTILRANKAMDSNNAGLARQLLTQAKALRPNNPANKALAERINSQSSQSTLEMRLSEVEALAQRQQWSQVLQKATSYATMHPGQERFVELQDEADEIVKLQRRVQQFLSRPERVADDGIRNAAIEALQLSLPLSSKSSELAGQLGQLAEIIDKYSKALPVIINSDEESYILVLGVGHVGVVEQKQIELKPGEYILEARRDGYKTKRLQISVGAGSNNTFYLASDEKI